MGRLPLRDLTLPQGSIWGPVLFSRISYRLNVNLEVVSCYFAANRLQLNINNTKCMVFSIPQKYRADDDLLIFHGGTQIKQVESFKYLAVFLDSHLNFKSHVEHIGRKLKQRILVLWRMRSFINQDLALSLITH